MEEGRLVFVVHKHKATSLHYAFKLEIGGVMPSWSIPKGPTLDGSVKRLAMPTGDHDLEYRKFEGAIPEGSPGAGPVMIWDNGTYVPEIEIRKGVRKEVADMAEFDKVARQSLEEGNLKFRLYGKKLKGSFALVRTAGIRGKESWLLIKHKDEFCEAGYNANDHDYSSVSGLPFSQIGKKEKA